MDEEVQQKADGDDQSEVVNSTGAESSKPSEAVGEDEETAEAALPTRLVLVRHGEAHCNADRFVGGHTACTGLTERGVRQVEALRDRWKGSGELGDVAALYTSTLPRAKQTAAILAPAIGGHVAVEDCNLCEFHTGTEADGITWEEFEERFDINFARNPFAKPYDSEGWEAVEEFRFRVGSTLFALANEHEGETIVLAVHGGIVDLSLSVFLGLPTIREARPADLYTYNASVTEWQRQPPPPGEGSWRRGGRWRLVRYNDAAHCDELT